MAVKIESKNYHINLGFGGLRLLRLKVAELTEPDIFQHYKNLEKSVMLYSAEREKFFDDYNKKIAELDEKYEGKYADILDFLYETDCGGKMDPAHCKSIYGIIKDYNDEIPYGYVGRPDCAKFADFKQLVKDCVDTDTAMEW